MLCGVPLGHGADVKCIDWHPSKSLIVSGSKDNQQPVKLWDPKAGQGISTLYDIFNSIVVLCCFVFNIQMLFRLQVAIYIIFKIVYTLTVKAKGLSKCCITLLCTWFY